MNPADAPFDHGLQPERTSLAWQRTTLALAVAFLVTARLLAHESNPLSLVVGGAGIVITVGLFVIGHRRHLATHRALTSEGERARFHTAGPMLAWAVVTLVLALLGLGAVVVLMLRG